MNLRLPLAFVLSAATCAADETPPPGAVINVVGLAVVRENFDTEAANPYKPFGLEAGTRLSLVFRLPERRIICFDPDESSVDAIVDDQGTNLMALAHRLQVPGFLGHGCGTARDGQIAHVEIFGGTTPAPGATIVQTRGKVVFYTGSQRAKIGTPVGLAENGAEFKAGERFQFQLARWEDGGIAGKGVNLSLRLGSHHGAIAMVNFFDGEKNLIESRPAGVAAEGTGDQRVFLLHYQLAAKPEKLSMEVEYWSDMQRVEVPFEVKHGLGGEP